jgi:hypothetical protein
VKAGRVGISGKGVDDEDRVGAFTVEFTVGLVGNRNRIEFSAALQRKSSRWRNRYVPGLYETYAPFLNHFIFSEDLLFF